MASSDGQSAGQMLGWILSRGLMGIGAILFLVGDRALKVFAGMSFLPALMVSVLGGLVLCVLGFQIAQWYGQPFGKITENEE